ncbi:NAD(P)-binding protein [Aspergillus unguis]
MLSLKDKVIIITGSSSGIGLATVKVCLELDAFVFGVDISPAPSSLVSNPRFKSHQVNLCQPGAPEDVVARCQAAFNGRIDSLLNVAGVMDTNSSVDNLDPAEWDKVMAVNLTVPAMLSKHVVNVFRAQGGGNIVNVSSKAGQSGAVAGAAYTASKHGLIGLTKNIAWRFHKENIRCNAICPGAVVTGIASSIDRTQIDQNAMEVIGPVYALQVDASTPGDVKGVAPPEEAAKLLAFLASDAARQINGAVIPVDNAWSTI